MRIFDPGLWVGFNLLVDGPPGAGKLSFVRGLTEMAYPGVKLCVHDLQTEEEAQAGVVSHLLASVSEEGRRRSRVVHVIRHLHRLPEAHLTEFIEQLGRLVSRNPSGGADRTPIRIHATSYDSVVWPMPLQDRLLAIFPCRIHLSSECARQRDLNRLVRQMVADLNRRYRRNVVEVDAEIVEALRRNPLASLHEMRNLIERVYVASPGRRLSRTVLHDIEHCPS